MSLAVWFPGTQDIKDYGLRGTEWINDNVTLVNDGKLGRCLSFNGTNSRLSTTGFQLSNIWSFSVWIKDDPTLTSWRVVLMLNTAGSDADTQMSFWVVATHPTNNRPQFEVCANARYISSVTYTPGQWNHFAATYDGQQILVYLNGIKIYTLSNTNTKLERYNLTIGAQSTNEGGGHVSARNCFIGLMNDLRIWDNEVISPKQIKLLSQGLFLHYPLSREGFGCDNLLINTNKGKTHWSWSGNGGSRSFEDYEGTGVKMTTVAAANSGSWSVVGYNDGQIRNHILPNTKYTLSFDACFPNSGVITCNIMEGNATHAMTNSATLNVTKDTWEHFSCVLTSNSTIEVTSQYIYMAVNNVAPTTTVGISVYFKNIKLEIGEKATPWTPHPEDELYYDMGLNTGNTNLLTKSAINPANWQHTYPNCTSYTGDGYDNLFTMVTTSNYEHVYLPVTVTANQQYTFSVTYQVLDSFELWQSYRPFSFQVLSAAPTNADTYNNVIGSILIGNTAMASPQRGSTTFTPTGTTIWLNIPGAYYKDGSTSYNKRVKFSRLKLETGGTATPWVSAESDPDRSGNIVYDVSGFGHNGELYATDNTASFIYETNTPRYSLAINPHSYNSTTSSKAGTAYIKGNCAITNPNQLTIAFWCYARNLGYGGHTTQGVFCTTSMIGDSIGTDYQDSAMNHRDSAINVNMSNSTSQLYLSITFIANEWHHYAFTYDGQYARSYRDGVLQDTKNFSSATPLDSFTSIILGLSRAGGVWRRNDNTYSDLRAYATALSAEDVLALYNAPMSLANNGTLLTQGEFSEV